MIDDYTVLRFGLLWVVLALHVGEFMVWRTVRLKEVGFPFITAGLGLACC